jgi:uncharacterized protein
MPAMKPPIRLVLDTNVVLDCFVFRDPATLNLMSAVQARHVEALVHPLTLDELRRVLAYPQFRLEPTEQQKVLNRYVEIGTLAVVPDGFSRDTLLLPGGFPRCRDPDDDLFLALARHSRADGLVTKDKALLKLRRKARSFGVAIATLAELKLG